MKRQLLARLDVYHFLRIKLLQLPISPLITESFLSIHLTWRRIQKALLIQFYSESFQAQRELIRF